MTAGGGQIIQAEIRRAVGSGTIQRAGVSATAATQQQLPQS